MRVLFSGGGTAGHINPAIAMAEIIKKNQPRAEIAFVGTPNGMESRLIPREGYPFYPIDICGFSRSLSPSNLRALFLSVTSPRKAARLIDAWRPDLVIGTGGYVCYPLVAAAAKQGVACALHESNALPGLAVRRLARHVNAIWLNFAESEARLPARHAPCVRTGNPLRAGFLSFSREKARQELGISADEPFVLSFGGSLGAEAITAAIARDAPKILAHFPSVRWLHGCGRTHADAWKVPYSHLYPRVTLAPYIDNMPLYMAAADIVICRAGAMTVSEAALCGKCTVFIPSPYVANDHQTKNAAIPAERGAAVLLREDALPGGALGRMVADLLADTPKRRRMEEAIRAFAIPDANRLIWQEIARLARK